jgi:hypothetical protein
MVVIGRALFQEHAKDPRDQHGGRREAIDDVEPLDRFRLGQGQLGFQEQVLAEQARDHQHDRHIMQPGNNDGPRHEAVLPANRGGVLTQTGHRAKMSRARPTGQGLPI